MDWAGKTIYTVTKHKRTNAATELVVKDMFTYSPQDKLLVHKQKINTLPEQLICSNTYDELGQLISKKVGGSDATGQNGLQKVDYTYNIRGWLKKINEVEGLDNDLFAFKINYEDPENSVALFNGNISETYWKTASDNLKRKYSYQYDDLNRLLEGNYSREGGNFKNSYLETMNYDKNGNIQTMYRNGDNDDVNYEFNIDNLVYTYDQNNKNLLKKVFDASNSPQGFKDDSNGFEDPEDDYQYDANGNLTADANKKIQNITYNHLNLPVHIVFETGEITYLYNATGQKLQKSVEGSDSITTDYLTGFQYHNEALKHFAHAEGYVDVVEGKFKYVFNYTDHLGNIRLSYSDADDNNTISENEILEENHYYPFGLKHSAYNTQHQGYIRQDELNNLILLQMPKFAGDGSYNYKYNGKEYQDELGLNMYDYGSRLYDPARAGWSNIDPLAEKMRKYSPYNYCFDNPMRFTDPDGMMPADVIISGNNKYKALVELQSSVSGQLNLSMDVSGKVSYSLVSGSTISADAQQLVNAIDDHSIVVKVDATTSTTAAISGDAFNGNTVTQNATGNTVVANQTLNPDITSDADNYYGKPGADSLHAVTEGYQGGLISQASGVSAQPAVTNSQGQVSNPVYNAAHAAATPPSGPINAAYVDSTGNIIPSPTPTSHTSIYVEKPGTPAMEINSIP
jgi:RHS repeat-associated protein